MTRHGRMLRHGRANGGRGRRVDPAAARIGNEELESWLLRQLSPRIGFRFSSIMIDDARIVLLEIDRAFRHPVQFAGTPFVRVG